MHTQEIAATLTAVGIVLFVVNLCVTVRARAPMGVPGKRVVPTWPTVQ